MLDTSVIITVIPPIISAIFAYLLARKRNDISERINKAKIDAEIQNQALMIVKGMMNDMRDEFKREISTLREENDSLKEKIESTERDVKRLHEQLRASDELVATLKGEIASLRTTIRIYEEEIARLKK